MSPETCVGARVTVVPFGEIVRRRCHRQHDMTGVSLAGPVGVVDRIDERVGEHCYVVV